MIGLLITAVLFSIAGCVTGRRSLAESFLLGIGVVGGALYIFGVFHVPFFVTIALVLVAGLLGCWVTRSRTTSATQQPSNPATIVATIPLLLLAIPAAIVPLNDFDGRAFWLLKAKALAHERVIDGPFFHNQIVNDPRNQYPLLLPLDAATVMMTSGDSDDREVRWLYLLTFAALVFAIARRVNPWCGAILAWIPQFSVSNEGGALTAYSDIALAAFVACAFLDLLDGQAPFRFGLWLAFLVLTKNEGLPIACILLAVGIASFGRRIVPSTLPVLIAIAALFAWRSHIPKTDEEDYLGLLSNLPSNLNRLLPAAAEFAKHVFDFSRWGLFWIAAVIALAILAWRKEWHAPAAVFSIAVLYLGVYVITLWNMRDLINVSADRLLMHMIGPALFAIARVTDATARSRYAQPRYSPTPT